MEAPLDKVWIENNKIVWTYKPKSAETHEYIRKDAFIEKAWNWIEDNLLSSNQQDKSRLYYRQFENYIKGE